MQTLEHFLIENLVTEVLNPDSIKFYPWASTIGTKEEQTFPSTLNDYQVQFNTDDGKTYMVSINKSVKAKDPKARMFLLCEIKNGRKNFKTMMIPKGQAIRILGTALKIYQDFKENGDGRQVGSIMMVMSKGMMNHGQFFAKVLDRAFRSKPRLKLEIIGAEEESVYWDFPAIHLTVPALKQNYPVGLYKGDAQGELYSTFVLSSSKVSDNLPDEKASVDVAVAEIEKEEPVVAQTAPKELPLAVSKKEVKKKEIESKEALKSKVEDLVSAPKMVDQAIIPDSENEMQNKLAEPTIDNKPISLAQVKFTKEDEEKLFEKYPKLSDLEYKVAYILQSNVSKTLKDTMLLSLSIKLEDLEKRTSVHGLSFNRLIKHYGSMIVKYRTGWGTKDDISIYYIDDFAKAFGISKEDVTAKNQELVPITEEITNDIYNALRELDNYSFNRFKSGTEYTDIVYDNLEDLGLIIRKILKDSGEVITMKDAIWYSSGDSGAYFTKEALLKKIPQLKVYLYSDVLENHTIEEIESALDGIPPAILAVINPSLGMMASDPEVAKISFVSNWTTNGGSNAQKLALNWLSDFGDINDGSLYKVGGRGIFDKNQVSKNGVNSFKVMYEQTQKFLAEKYGNKYKNGIGTIKLYRGIGLSTNEAYRYIPGAIESWSTAKSTANKFAKMMADDDKGTVLEITVPFNTILATYESLKGIFPPEDQLKGKQEHILLGGALKKYPCKISGKDGIIQFSEWLRIQENEMVDPNEGRVMRIVTEDDIDYDEVVNSGLVAIGPLEDAKIGSKLINSEEDSTSNE